MTLFIDGPNEITCNFRKNSQLKNDYWYLFIDGPNKTIIPRSAEKKISKRIMIHILETFCIKLNHIFKKICILSFYSRYRSFTGLTFVNFTDSYLVTSFLYYLAGIWEFYYNGSNAAKEITNIYIRVNFSFNQCI